ncbi:hypothetical protein [Neobacillus cucumis]|uniref:hypothetical protein n=1 Tax=Neobacillus cucumis TaxID=1740721 RepID=UPI0028531B70|nr:hypothetical protein [Neobacillus cucumis]MDR4947288.1 hypothetical protein [Neobacillus cucumis]
MVFVGLFILLIGSVTFISQLAYTYQEFHDKDLKLSSKLVSFLGILDIYLLSLIAILLGFKLTIKALFQ